MRAPLSWLKEFASIPASLSEEAISDAFIRVGFEVEEIIHQGADLSGPLVTGHRIRGAASRGGFPGHS